MSHKPPGYNTRYGKTPITHHTTNHDSVFRPSGAGTRLDDTWISQGGFASRGNNVFLGHTDDVIMPDVEMFGGGHQGSGIPAECDATCSATEFFCSKSCSCISSDLHCGRLR